MNIDELFENAVMHWRDNKGVGTAIIPKTINSFDMVIKVLDKMYKASPSCKVLIVTESFKDRLEVIENFKAEDAECSNEDYAIRIRSGIIKVLTAGFVKEQMKFSNYYTLCILYKLSVIDSRIISVLNSAKFKLVVITGLLNNADSMTLLYRNAPLLQDFKQNELDMIRMTSPVEEIRHALAIDPESDDAKSLEYCNEYISTSLAVFGSFDVMNQANSGNQELNISAMSVCEDIARANGWNENLDMNLEFNVNVDKLYNPVSLRDRASMTYEIIRNRQKLLSDYSGKLDVIADIVKSNPTKKILIINKRGEFASAVTDYINTLNGEQLCMNYHDKLLSIPAVNVKGDPIYYKTGQNAGQRKMMGAKAQKTLAVEKFNRGYINVLSTGQAPDKSLDIDVDIIIITSPFCEDIKSYLYRLAKVNILTNVIELHTLYCKNTLEQKAIEEKELSETHIVKNADEDEFSSSFIIED